MAIRVIGGSIGYAIYYNVFYEKFFPLVTENVGGTSIIFCCQNQMWLTAFCLGLLEQHRITNFTVITKVIQLTGGSQVGEIMSIPEVAALGTNVYNEIVMAGQTAFASAYRYVYLVSIGKCPTKSRRGRDCC